MDNDRYGGPLNPATDRFIADQTLNQGAALPTSVTHQEYEERKLSRESLSMGGFIVAAPVDRLPPERQDAEKDEERQPFHSWVPEKFGYFTFGGTKTKIPDGCGICHSRFNHHFLGSASSVR